MPAWAATNARKITTERQFMARTKKKEEMKPIKEDIREVSAPEVLEQNFMPYAMSVIVSRAIPEIDGLKPSHRKILYTMYEMGLLSGGRTKSANVAARTMLLNPHGDCLHGNTIFEDLSGKHYTIEELYNKKIPKLECLSVNPKTGTIERTEISDFRIGQYAKVLYKITLSNGCSITTTENHPFMCRDLNDKMFYVKAEDLTVGTTLFNKYIYENKGGYWAIGRTPLHKIINNIPNGKVVHHKDFNKKNNLKENTEIISRSEHAEIHHDYEEGLSLGRISMFSKNGNHRRMTKEKNRFLMSTYNKIQPVIRLYKVIDWMISQDIEINPDTYAKARIDSGIYRPPHLDTLILAGYGTSITDLINRRCEYENYISESYKSSNLKKDFNETSEHLSEERKKIESFVAVKDLGKYSRGFVVLDELHRKGLNLTLDNYLTTKKQLSSLYKSQKYRIAPVFTEKEFNAATSLYYSRRVVVTNIEKIIIDDAEPMYDFTSSVNENVLLPSGNCNLWICVHNSSNYEAAVRLTQHNETLLTPLIDGKGNFGKHYSRDMACAASRYTEMKLMPVASEFFKSIKKNTVEFVDNYDSTRKEPVLLPVTFPSILANPTEGIAVGMASSIPSFNLSELCDATILRIKHPRKDIAEVMPAPDFTTGGALLYDPDAVKEIYKTGKGSVALRSKYTVDAKARVIEINEIPYTTTAEAIIENVVSLVKTGKLPEISDIRNEIGLHGFRIAIDYKRGVDPDQLMLKLFRLSKFQDTYSCNITVLIDGKPRSIGVVELLDEWIKWRRDCVKKELTFDLEKKRKELHLLEGLVKVLLDIDKAVKIIRKTKNDEDVIPNLMKGFDLDEIQAEYVANIKLRNLNKDYILNRTKNIDQIREDIADIEGKLASDKEVDKLMISTLKDIQKTYGQSRRTEIVTDYEEMSASTAEKKPDYPVKVYITKEGYVKKVALTSLKTDPEIKIKDGDEIVRVYDSMNSKELIVFSDKQTVYKVLLSDLKDAKPSEIPDYINNLCEFEEGENILHVCTSDSGKNVLIGFANGKVAKFPLAAYETKQNRKKLLNAYGGIAAPLKVYVIDEDEDFAMQGSNGKLLVFSSAKVPLKTTKSTQGVQVLRLSGGNTAISFGKVGEYHIKTPDDYRSPNIPAAGQKRKITQISIFD